MLQFNFNEVVFNSTFNDVDVDFYSIFGTLVGIIIADSLLKGPCNISMKITYFSHSSNMTSEILKGKR